MGSSRESPIIPDMILLLSNPIDKSTIKISTWLKFFNAPYLYLTELDIYRCCTLDIDKNILFVNEHKYSLDDLSSVWIRRPFSMQKTEVIKEVKKMDTDLAYLLCQETSTITRYIYDYTKKHALYFLANPFSLGTNKLEELHVARKVGLNIPASCVTTNKKDVVDFIHFHSHIITKSLYNAKVFHPWSSSYKMFTNRITDDDIKNLPESFAPSLIQEEIIKEYDIRAFYLDGDMFSMAILPDSSSFYDVDYRQYDLSKLRLLPIDLDDKIKGQLRAFMKIMGLMVGCIDLIKSVNGHIYFIEVNHEGQFDMIDEPCNYGIHKIIAEKLIKFNK